MISDKPSVSSLVCTQPPGEIHEAQADVIQTLGYKHIFFKWDEPIPPGTQIIMIQGPYGPLFPLIRQIQNQSAENRPILVYWFQQSLNILRPVSLCQFFAQIFSELCRKCEETGFLERSFVALFPKLLEQKGKRLDFLGDIQWLSNHNLLDLLALSSTYYANYLAKKNIPSIIVPRGYHPIYGLILNQKRDIAAVWMGRIRTRRRKKAINYIRQELEKRGLVMHVYDGQENPFIYGEKRASILNRALFVINLFFSGPTDELSLRFYFAGANGAVVITEPGFNNYPFKNKIHFIECPIKAIPDTIEYYIENHEKWKFISQNMLILIKNELTLKKSIQKILAQAEHLFISRF